MLIIFFNILGNKRRKISEFEGDTGDNGSLAKAFMMLVTNYPPSSSVVATMICPVSFMQICDSLSEKQVISGSIHEFRDYLGRDDVWYIVDARKLKEYRGKTTLQVNYYKKFDGLGVKIMYMPVWSLSEIKQCKNNIDIFKNLKGEEILDLCNKWVGFLVNANIMSFVGETTQGNDISHRLVHIRTNVPEEEEAEEGKNLLYPFTSSTLRGPSNKPSVVQNDNEGVPYYSQIILEFASDYVAEGVINRLSEINKQVLLDFVKTSVDVNEYSSLRGIIFERLAHQKLLNGGD
ncbi:hypothetical protein RhiirA5_502296 [Rhizophagus irregularis]|uniref:Crinkler family protein n=1 Tax=Rhizophagus irregularis TaxID=588596 RepID=A0A2N0PEB6_9GLOM|nr:hypothetical protein RhiirA5_502296 [Rhizophagus irregularis]